MTSEDPSFFLTLSSATLVLETASSGESDVADGSVVAEADASVADAVGADVCVALFDADAVESEDISRTSLQSATALLIIN